MEEMWKREDDFVGLGQVRAFAAAVMSSEKSLLELAQGQGHWRPIRGGPRQVRRDIVVAFEGEVGKGGEEGGGRGLESRQVGRLDQARLGKPASQAILW
jgi:hypothetical protein